MRKLMLLHIHAESLNKIKWIADLRRRANQVDKVMRKKIEFMHKNDVSAILFFQSCQIEHLLDIKEAIVRFLDGQSDQTNLRASFKSNKGKERLNDRMVEQEQVARARSTFGLSTLHCRPKTVHDNTSMLTHLIFHRGGNSGMFSQNRLKLLAGSFV